MKAAYIEKFGGPEVLKYGDLPDPVAGPARSWSISSRRASTAPTGRCAPATTSRPIPSDPGPRFLRRGQRGRRGRHRSQGRRRGVRRAEAGREGAYAEKIAIDAAIVAKKPAGLSHVDAAALALTGLTAICSVEDTLKLEPARRS